MALEFQQEDDGRVLIVRVGGKLTKADYETFVPEVDGMVAKAGKIRILFVMHDFHGWTVPAAWEDLKFGLRHFSGIERLGLVGEKRWQSWMIPFCRPFTKAELRYFDSGQLEEAKEWIKAVEASTV